MSEGSESTGDTHRATALDLPETKAALAAYQARARQSAGGGALSVIAGAVLFATLGDDGLGGDVATGCVMVGVLAIVLGLFSLAAARRMRHALDAGPWIAYPALIVPRGTFAAKIVLGDPATGSAFPLVIRTIQQRYDLAQPDASGVMWWCGDPLRGGVLSQPGGGSLVWTAPVRGARARRLTVGWATEGGLLGRPVPVQPQAGSLPPGVSLRKAAPPTASRRRRTGVWRWVVLLSAAVLGTGIWFEQAARNDPAVDVTIRSVRPDHSCTVTWQDPFDGVTRTGPFRCADDADPDAYRWDSAFVVSYGPWKGEIYPVVERGDYISDAEDSVVMMELGGMLALLVGLVGGTVSFVRRRRLRRLGPVPLGPVPLAAPAGHTPAPAPEVTYALLASRVWTGKRPRRPRRPEPDFRQGVPWWRVPTLRRASGLSAFLIGLVAAPFMVAAAWFEEGFQIRLGCAFVLIGTVVNGIRFVRSGRPAVRLFARAAAAPVPVPKRYVLLGHQGSSAPFLAVFPAHGGPDDRPEGLLRLLPYNLPDAPTGSLELRGWLDLAVDGSPVVMTRADGRALWPMDLYLEAGTPGFNALLERLAPPSAPSAPSAPPDSPTPPDSPVPPVTPLR
ncbi:hypothetical protein SLA_3464 [Streptomyces laurentii]|uniref:Uncharacterized protein n=1 Tax=Streptomyces laurentii TaxID=39478 RepID=A0A160P1U6_STRLU|nr:hypothetical protein SLA_3464 [Streptomyces laurentii]